jgi:type I restriction enzyme S subunit
VEVSDDVASPFVLAHDDVLIVRYNGDINRVARAAIYKGENKDKTVYPDKLMRLRVDTGRMSPDFLVFAMSSAKVRAQIEAMGKTTAGQIGVSGKDAKAFEIPVPPIADQTRIVSHLDAVQATIRAVTDLQSSTKRELDAFQTSILAKAFSDEL